MLNIVIPMAGLGSRFAKAGYTFPKPLIPVHAVPMIEVVIKNLTPSSPHRFIFICQQEQIESYQLDTKLKHWAPGAEIITLSAVTQGAACTVLQAKLLLESDEPLMIANCDQYIDINIDDYLAVQEAQNLDGLIMTMEANDPKWSFVGFDDHGLVNRVVEKQVISDEATVGIYNFRRSREFVRAAESMIAQHKQVNGEYYVAPAYNELITEGKRVGIYSIGADRNGMYGLGTPADLEYFLSLDVSQQFRENHA